MMLLIHECRGAPGRSDPRGINDGIFIPKVKYNIDYPENVHYDGTTVGYIDGHAKWMCRQAVAAERDAKYWIPLYMRAEKGDASFLAAEKLRVPF